MKTNLNKLRNDKQNFLFRVVKMELYLTSRYCKECQRITCHRTFERICRFIFMPGMLGKEET